MNDFSRDLAFNVHGNIVINNIYKRLSKKELRGNEDMIMFFTRIGEVRNVVGNIKESFGVDSIYFMDLDIPSYFKELERLEVTERILNEFK